MQRNIPQNYFVKKNNNNVKTTSPALNCQILRKQELESIFPKKKALKKCFTDLEYFIKLLAHVLKEILY